MENNFTPLFMDKMTVEKLKNLYEENGASAYLIGIPKEYILEGNVEYIQSFITSIDAFEHGKENVYAITTNAYDTDSRELFEIEEWVEYLKRIIKEVPRLFYHVIPPCKLLIIQCLCTKEATRTPYGTINHTIDKAKFHELLSIIRASVSLEEGEEVISEITKILSR